MNLSIQERIAASVMCVVATSLFHAIHAHGQSVQTEFAPLEYEIQLESILKNDSSGLMWYHPRVTAIPAADPNSVPTIFMTLQKHLRVSDHYSGLWVMHTNDLGRHWSTPDEREEMAWVYESNGVHIGVADVTPGWHDCTKKLLAIGGRVRYSKEGQELDDKPRSNQTSYAVFDPKTEKWSRWKVLELPNEVKFNFARSACAQWIVKPDGTLLLPFYIGRNATEPWKTTVVHCSFDGNEMKYLGHGNEIEQPDGRGLYEPSLAYFDNRYFLTIRHDSRSYVTNGADGLNFGPIIPWTFDGDADLGSYNTQQHWLTHSDGLFLIYTRRGASNDHIERHRAPLFIAQVNLNDMCVVRRTERILVPERGAELGNFGATSINAEQSWVTVSESKPTGLTVVARLRWSKPNRLVTEATPTK